MEARQGTIGFTLNPQYQGRGFATEAGRALLRMGFEDLGLHRIFASCDARNNAVLGSDGTPGHAQGGPFSRACPVQGWLG